MEQPQVEEKRVKTPTHAETFRDGRKCTREPERMMHDSSETMGALTSQRRKMMSLGWDTSYMDMMSESVEVEPSLFEEELQQTIWVDSMVEEYYSIIRNKMFGKWSQDQQISQW